MECQLLVVALLCTIVSSLGPVHEVDKGMHDPCEASGKPDGSGYDDTQAIAIDDHVDRGFTARRAVLHDKYIGFQDLIYDVNVGPTYFNKQYGFFRAEKDGVHVFSFQFISTKNKHFRVSLRVNGHPQVWALAQRNYRQAGNSATVFLQAGQFVYCYLEEGAIFEPKNSYRGYGTFSGHRITYDETSAVVPRSLNRRIGEEERKDLDEYGDFADNLFKKP